MSRMQQLSGVLGILKPGGITSAQVLELLKDTIRGQFHAVGHGGTLDPMTTGVLGKWQHSKSFIQFGQGT